MTSEGRRFFFFAVSTGRKFDTGLVILARISKSSSHDRVRRLVPLFGLFGTSVSDFSIDIDICKNV